MRLLETPYKIIDVAGMAGFDNAKYFSQVFKQPGGHDARSSTGRPFTKGGRHMKSLRDAPKDRDALLPGACPTLPSPQGPEEVLVRNAVCLHLRATT